MSLVKTKMKKLINFKNHGLKPCLETVYAHFDEKFEMLDIHIVYMYCIYLYYIQAYFRQSSISSDGCNILYGNSQPHQRTPCVRTGDFHHWLTWRSFFSLLRSSLSGSVVSDASTYKNKPELISHNFCKHNMHNKIQS